MLSNNCKFYRIDNLIFKSYIEFWREITGNLGIHSFTIKEEFSYNDNNYIVLNENQYCIELVKNKYRQLQPIEKKWLIKQLKR